MPSQQFQLYTGTSTPVYQLSLRPIVASLTANLPIRAGGFWLDGSGFNRRVVYSSFRLDERGG